MEQEHVTGISRILLGRQKLFLALSRVVLFMKITFPCFILNKIACEYQQIYFGVVD